MTTVRTPIAAVDAIQRVPVECWIGPWDNGGACFPNYPVWCDADGQAVELLDERDDRRTFSGVDRRAGRHCSAHDGDELRITAHAGEASSEP